MTETTERIFKYTPVFKANQAAYESGLYRVIVNQGSTRSSKTYSTCQLLILIARNEKKSISIVSKSLPHLKKGALRDFIQILETLEIYDDANFNKTDNIYFFPETGSYIEFFGVEQADKVRGPGRNILFCNEANLISRETYRQLAYRTTGTIFLDLNPADQFSWVYDEADKPGNKLIISTYKNNRSNLSKEQIKEIEDMEVLDENEWRVFGLGLRGHSTETIFTHWKECKELPGRGEVAYAADFGFNVPSAIVQCEFYENSVYVKELLYETRLTTTDLIGRMKDLEISKTSEIYCDAAEPKTIEEINRAGFNAKPADKAVLEGIRKMKSLPLFVTAGSENLIKELRGYRWKVDNDGRVLDEPVKFHDHLVDATRYCIWTKLSQPTFSVWTV